MCATTPVNEYTNTHIICVCVYIIIIFNPIGLENGFIAAEETVEIGQRPRPSVECVRIEHRIHVYTYQTVFDNIALH